MKQSGCPNLAVCPNIPDFTLVDTHVNYEFSLLNVFLQSNYKAIFLNNSASIDLLLASKECRNIINLWKHAYTANDTIWLNIRTFYFMWLTLTVDDVC